MTTTPLITSDIFEFPEEKHTPPHIFIIPSLSIQQTVEYVNVVLDKMPSLPHLYVKPIRKHEYFLVKISTWRKNISDLGYVHIAIISELLATFNKNYVIAPLLLQPFGYTYSYTKWDLIAHYSTHNPTISLEELNAALIAQRDWNTLFGGK